MSSEGRPNTTPRTRFHEEMRQADERLCWRLLDGGSRVCILDRGHDNGVHEHDHEESLELACQVLPPGYAIWTWGREMGDELVYATEERDA